VPATAYEAASSPADKKGAAAKAATPFKTPVEPIPAVWVEDLQYIMSYQ